MQRSRLLTAVVGLIAEQGLEGASIEAICKRAGVSRRTFYEVFEDREACLLAAFDKAIERLAAWLVPIYERQSTWRERMRACLGTLLAQLDSEPGLARLCVVEVPRAGSEIAERRRRVLEVITDAVEQGRAESKHRDALAPVTAQGVVGGALAVIHAGLLGGDGPLIALVNPLMGMIVHPYLGPAVARAEMSHATPTAAAADTRLDDPFKDLRIRFTYRTALVLESIAAEPHASNRVIADASGIVDEGQMSRLLTRLQRAGLIDNQGDGQARGESNAWALTERGVAVQAALGERD